jgi:hypothetical protein
MAIPASPSGVVTELLQVQAMMAALSPALAAIQPALKVIDAVVSLFEVVKAVPTLVLGDVQGFVDALATCAQKMASLSSIVPQLSVPAMVLDVIQVLATFCRATADQLRGIGSVLSSAEALKAHAVASGDAALQAAAECSIAQADSMLSHATASMGPFGSLLGLVTGLISMLPSPVELPGVPDLDGLTPTEAAEALDFLADVLGAIQIPGA